MSFTFSGDSFEFICNNGAVNYSGTKKKKNNLLILIRNDQVVHRYVIVFIIEGILSIDNRPQDGFIIESGYSGGDFIKQ
jgi:hypothetical protein